MSADSTGRPEINLYGRPGCHLCDAAAALLDGLSQDLRFDWQVVDIDGDAALLARYDWIVPVVALGEVELLRAPIQPAILRERLRAALAGVSR